MPEQPGETMRCQRLRQGSRQPVDERGLAERSIINGKQNPNDLPPRHPPWPEGSLENASEGHLGGTSESPTPKSRSERAGCLGSMCSRKDHTHFSPSGHNRIFQKHRFGSPHHKAGLNHKSKALRRCFCRLHPIQQPSSVRSFRHRHGKTNQINIRTNFFQERLLAACCKRDRKSCGGDQSKPYGLAVLVRQSWLAFDGVREGVAQIQDGPHAVFFSIFSHHRCFDLAGPQRKRVTRFNFCRKQCIPVITNKSQEVRISE